MESLADRLLAQIRGIRLIDPHTHINPHAPAARSLTDLLGYHYYTELAHSAGLPKSEIEERQGVDLVRRLLQTLSTCANTVQYQWLVEIARDCFDFGKDQFDASDADELFARAERRLSEPGWTDEVFAQAGLDAVFLTNDFDDPLEGFDTARYVPCLRTDDLVFKLGEASVQQRLESATGCTPRHVLTALGRLFDHFVARGARACAISLPPDFEPIRPADAEFAAALERLLAGRAGADDERAVSMGVFWSLADRCEEFRLPFDLMIGVRRGVYATGVYQGQDLFDQRTSLAQFRRLFNEKSAVRFPVSVLTHGQNQELASYAWIFPNVITSGHWWYSNIPCYIEADTRARLEAVPMTKQIGYYSDAYKLEFIKPKFDMYRRCLARVLAEECVLRRHWSEERAVELARTVLRGNVERIFPAPKS